LTAAEIVRHLGLAPHPEGGHFRETFRDPRTTEDGRAASTAIYFLLARGERSRWHRVDAVEVWHFYAGAPLLLETAASEVAVAAHVTLGPDLAAGERPQAIVPGGAWAGGGKPRRLDAGRLHGGAGLPVRTVRARPRRMAAGPGTLIGSLERFHIDRNRNRSSIFALSHFRTENRIPLFLKML